MAVLAVTTLNMVFMSLFNVSGEAYITLPS